MRSGRLSIRAVEGRTQNADTPADPVWPTPRAHVRTGRKPAVQGTGFALPPHSNICFVVVRGALVGI